MVGLARTLANELGPRGIRVNTVHPGAVAIPMTLNQQQVEAVAAACLTLRDRLLVQLLFETGLRPGEVLALWLELSVSIILYCAEIVALLIAAPRPRHVIVPRRVAG